MTSKDIVLEGHDLSRRFGGVEAVKGVNITIKANTIHSVIGPNGAGKTTLFNLLTKTIAPTSGSLYLLGNDVTNAKPRELFHKGVGRSFQITSVFRTITVRENLLLVAYSGMHRGKVPIWRDLDSDHRVIEKVDQILTELQLKEYTNKRVGELSYGTQRLVEIGTALAGNPKLLLLDEPAAGLTEADAIQLRQRLSELRGRLAIGMVEHKMDVILPVSDEITVMNFGQVVFHGTPEEVINSPIVRSIYFGE